jgi:site-specific DNA-methyltransferase (adenine-specific)
MKPYYETELGKLYHGDCLEVMQGMDAVDLVLTDIPYGEVNRADNGLRNLDKGRADEVTFDLEEFISEILWYAKSFYIFCGTEQVSLIRHLMVIHELSTRLCIWEKTNPSPMNGEHLWLSSIECCVFGKKSRAIFHPKCESPVFRFPVARNQVHPTQKPTALFQKLILSSSEEFQTVLDPCLGSGTSAYLCERLNRNWVGIEKEEKYCEIAAKRIENERKQLKLF